MRCEGCDRPDVEVGNELFLDFYEPMFQCRDYEYGDFHYDIFAQVLQRAGLNNEEFEDCILKAVAVESVIKEQVLKKVDKPVISDGSTSNRAGKR